jgi:hypothetical protein
MESPERVRLKRVVSQGRYASPVGYHDNSFV